jgi:prepilin-type N-terminal cleavage/methylation domain-containing protein
MTTRRRGYTVVELMMALAVLAVSISGVLAMQKVTAVSNANARHVAVANGIAQTWIEQLRADARLWNRPADRNDTSDLNETLWLQNLGTDNDDYYVPTWDSTREIGRAFDVLGRPLPDGDAATAFCVHLLMRELTPPASTELRGEIRATVRVFWPRTSTPNTFCAGNQNATASGGVGDPAQLSAYHFVYHTTVIRQHR